MSEEKPSDKEIIEQSAQEDNHNHGRIQKAEIEEEMKQSYLDYAMSVIISRALPDVRDGLKPVHRRILYAMNDMGMLFNKPSKKCARIVGEVLGKYHPHGDTAVYDALVRMAQDFSLRYPLIKGQGNFGSIDGDNAAAMRYTEAKLSKISSELLTDIDKDTVDFVPNFDNTLKEPGVLPAKLPNLLINGSSGIAVGMATNIPPHNIQEVIDATIALIDDPELEDNEIIKIVKAPDFPTGGIIQGTAGIRAAYKTGKGKLILRAVTDIEEAKGRIRIIIKEIPYMVNKSLLMEQIAGLVKEKQIEGISDLRDESDRSGIRIVIELKKEATPKLILNRLFKFTKLQVSIGINLLSLVNNEPKTLNIKEILKEYIKHRQIIVTRRSQFELNKAESRAHILDGLIIALNNIDDVVTKIKASKDVNEAKAILIKDYDLTEIQSQSILEMRLQKLSSLEQEKIKTEKQELMQLIKELKELLASEKKILEVIKKEILELKETYGDSRKTQIVESTEDLEIEVEDLIKEEDVVVTITHSGYIKRIPVTAYKQQQRGGKGIIGQSIKEGDFIENIFIANTHAYLLFLTNKGQLYWLKVHEIPEASRQSMGKAIVNLVGLKQGEKINATIQVKEFDDQHFIFLATNKGTIKKTNLNEFSRPRQGGIKAIVLGQDEQLIKALLTDGEKDILLATENGMSVRFSEADVRPMGRASRGVRGIKLKNNDLVIGAEIINEDQTILTLTENGYGKRSSVTEYRRTARGGSGIKNIICSERNGKVVGIKTVVDVDDVIMISQKGILIRVSAKDVSVIGRNTQGMRLMKLSAGDRATALAKIVGE